MKIIKAKASHIWIQALNGDLINIVSLENIKQIVIWGKEDYVKKFHKKEVIYL